MSSVSRIVLAHCVQNDINLTHCIDSVGHFYFERDVAKVYEVVCDFYRKHEKIITSKLLDKILDGQNMDPEEQQELVDVFEEALDAHVDSKEFEFYLEELKKEYTKRLWQEAMDGKVEEDGEAVPGIKELMEQDPQKAYELFKSSISIHMEELQNADSSNCASLDESAEKFLADYEERVKNPEKAYGIRTGYDFLDQQSLGMHPGELFIVGGRHGAGKSVLILNIGVNAYRAGKNVLIVSIEMPREQYEQRFYACYCDLPFNAIRAGTLSKEQVDIMKDALKKVQEERKNSKHYFHIADITSVSAFTVEAEMKKATTKYGVRPDLIVVDYLGIMKSIDNSGSKADWQKVLAIAEELRGLARNKSIPVLSAVQLNRDKNKSKGTERISRSDGVGATCDVYLQIEEKPEEDDDDDQKKVIALDLDDVMGIFVGKMRNGESGRSFQLYKKFANILIKNKGVYKSRAEAAIGACEDIQVEEQPQQITKVPEDAEDKAAQQNGEFINT